MNTQFQLHPVQANILRELLFKPTARFSDLNIKDLTSDHFTFHINKLIETNLIEKLSNGQYTLTTTGKELANRLDTDEVKFERQAKVAVVLVCTKTENDQIYYLLQQRLKQPYYGFHVFPTGKIRWGETILETAERELFEETHLKADFHIVGVKHKMDYNTQGNLLEDKFFFVCKGENVQGQLLEKFEGGKNIWVQKGNIPHLPDLIQAVDESIKMTENDTLSFSETKYTTSKY